MECDQLVTVIVNNCENSVSKEWCTSLTKQTHLRPELLLVHHFNSSFYRLAILVDLQALTL